MAPTLDPPDKIYVDAAAGWCDLDSFDEAECELDKVRPSLRNHPLVLEVRWQLCDKLKRRAEALELANTMVKAFPNWPNGWLYKARSLSGMGRDDEALETALLGSFRFSSDQFELYSAARACCACGKVDDAKSLLERAVEVGGEAIRLMALEDRKLKPMWASLRKR